MIKDHYLRHKETIHNFTWRSLQILGKQGTTFLIFILCSKLLPVSEFGLYNYLLAIVFLLVMFSDFGISTATSKYVTEYNLTDKNKLRSVVFNSTIIIFLLSASIGVLIFLLGDLYLKEKINYIFYALPVIFFAPMTSLYDGVYRGLKRFKSLATITLIIGLFLVPIIYILIKNYGLVGALISQSIFYLAILIGLVLGYRELDFRFNKEIIKDIWKYSFVCGLSVLGYYLFSRVNILLMGHYGYIEEIAIYEILNKIFMILLIPFSIIGQVLSPNFTRFFVRKEFNKIYLKFKKYVYISIVTSLFFGLGSFIVLPLVIKGFFNNYYNETFFIFLLPCIVIASIQVYATYINSGIIIATGHVRLMTYINLFLGIFNIFLALFLMRIFGAIGIVYSTIILSAIGIVILHFQYWRKLKKLLID